MALMHRAGSTSASDRSSAVTRSKPQTVGLLVLAWLVLCGAAVGIGWLLTHPLTGSVGAADDDLAVWVAARRTPTLNDLADVGTLIGNTRLGQVALVAIALGFSLWQRSLLPAVFVGFVEAGLLSIYLVATDLVPRQRPPVEILDPGLVPDHSFPSGHVLTASALVGSIVVLTWASAPAARRWVTPLLLLPLCTVVARVYQGAHHLSDVLTSLVLAPVWIGTVAVVLLGISQGPQEDASGARAVRRGPAAGT
jgi:undecaprenyl-diphosphatase